MAGLATEGESSEEWCYPAMLWPENPSPLPVLIERSHNEYD